MEESLEMAKIAERDGVEKIVATPHLFRGDFINEDLSIIESKRSELSQALKENNVHAEILAGAEVHISHNLIDEIRKNRENLVLNQSSYMLVEFPSDIVFSGAKNLFFELMNEGIIPIITHPERNSVFIYNPFLLYELIQMGALSQANSGSFLGLYERRVEETVLHFLEFNFIHFIASDCHNTHSVVSRLSEAMKRARMIVGEEKARALVKDNPQAVLDDKELVFLSEPINPKEKEKTFKINIPDIFGHRRSK